MKAVVNAVHVATYPIHFVVERFHSEKAARIFKSKKTAKCAVGLVIVLAGSGLATVHVAFLPHVIVDAIAYTLHGYGALPFIKLLCHKLNLESIDE